MATQSDWSFSNFVHEEIAKKVLYPVLGWTDFTRDDVADRDKGIDYFAKAKDGRQISIQERFRDGFYGSRYNDFTIRYTRQHNPDPSRRASEFFKITADYFVYGVTNGKKDVGARGDNFIKWAVIDLAVLRRLFDERKIIIPDAFGTKPIDHGNGTITIEKRKNVEYSSEFIALDVPMLHKVFGAVGIIIMQKGFF